MKTFPINILYQKEYTKGGEIMRTTDLSKGTPWKVLVLFALPMILSVTLQQIYNIADSAIAGKMIGDSALAAVSASYPITMIYLSIATGLGVGCGVITSRYFGEGNYSSTKQTITTSLIFTTILSAIMIIFGILITPASLRLINTPDDIFSDSSLYLRFYCGGLLFTYLYNVITSIFQSLGNSKTPLYFLIFSTVLNIILDIIFVGPCKMEVLGLALGTFIAQGIAMTLSLLFLLLSIKKALHTEEKEILFNNKILKDILIIAIPSIIQGATISVGNFFIQRKINSYGSDLIAGYGAAYKICYVVVNIYGAYSNAISNYTSQNIGAGKLYRVKEGFKWSLLICVIFSFVMSLIFVLIPDILLMIFMDSDASTTSIEMGRYFIYIVAPFFIFMGLKIPSDGVLKGAKDMRSFMIATFADLIIRIVLSYALSYPFGYKGIFSAWPIGWAVGALISVTMYKVGRWKRLTGLPSLQEKGSLENI